jgi:hypothetical protein
MIWGVPYDDIVAAKKKSAEDCSEYEMQLREYRQYVKIIGFGQREGRTQTPLSTVKPHAGNTVS